jgi:hypothetical protein
LVAFGVMHQTGKRGGVFRGHIGVERFEIIVFVQHYVVTIFCREQC